MDYRKEIEDFKKELNGEMEIKLQDGDTTIKMKGDIASISFMVMGAVTSLYEKMTECVKPEVENPEEEIKKSLYELVDMAIEGAKTKKRLDEIEALKEKMKNTHDPMDILELMIKGMELMAKARGERK